MLIGLPSTPSKRETAFTLNQTKRDKRKRERMKAANCGEIKRAKTPLLWYVSEGLFPTERAKSEKARSTFKEATVEDSRGEGPRTLRKGGGEEIARLGKLRTCWRRSHLAHNKEGDERFSASTEGKARRERRSCE